MYMIYALCITLPTLLQASILAKTVGISDRLFELELGLTQDVAEVLSSANNEARTSCVCTASAPAASVLIAKIWKF